MPMLATQAAERGLSGARETSCRHGLSGGNSGQPAMLAAPAPVEVASGDRVGAGRPGRTSTGGSTGCAPRCRS